MCLNALPARNRIKMVEIKIILWNGEINMTYQQLAEVRKTLRVKWYRSPVDSKRMQELTERSNLQGWIQAGGHLALFVTTGILTYIFWAQQSWVGFVLALFVHGTISSFFEGIAPHELAHGSVFISKPLNKFFLYIFSFLSWWDFYDYATSHDYHHRYTLYPEGDRENLLPLEPSLSLPLLVQLFTVNVFSQPSRNFSKGGLIATMVATVRSAFGRVGPTSIPFNEWLQALHADKPEEHLKSIRWNRVLLLLHGALLVASIASGLWVLPLIISLPTFIGNWAVYFLGMTQHCGLRTNVADFRKCSRSIKLNPLAEFLYWHMNWHIEHHMYVAVPCYNLKKLAAEIADDMPEPRSLLDAWREMRDAWHRQKTDPDFQYDTPLPATAKRELAATPVE